MLKNRTASFRGLFFTNTLAAAAMRVTERLLLPWRYRSFVVAAAALQPHRWPCELEYALLAATNIEAARAKEAARFVRARARDDNIPM